MEWSGDTKLESHKREEKLWGKVGLSKFTGQVGVGKGKSDLDKSLLHAI